MELLISSYIEFAMQNPGIIICFSKTWGNPGNVGAFRLQWAQRETFLFLARTDLGENVLLHVRGDDKENVSVAAAGTQIQQPGLRETPLNTIHNIFKYLKMHSRNQLMIYRNQVASVLFCCLKLMYSIIPERLSAILAWLNNQNDDALKDCCKGSSFDVNCNISPPVRVEMPQ